MRALRIGIVNLMPRLETYEPLLSAWFEGAGRPLELAWIRLASHGYASSDPAHLAAHYTTYEAARARGPLDGFVVTGAPVEHLPLEEVRYWPELSSLLDDARAHVGSTLGICWGAMALAEREGARREVLSRKISGVFRHTVRARGAAVTGLSGDGFACPHSRFAGFSADEIARAEAEGRLVEIADGGEAGPALLATPDGRAWMHLGHPEYDAGRLGAEWRRDEAAGRTDVDPPRGYDLVQDRPAFAWGEDSRAFLRAWLARCDVPTREG